MFWNNFHSEGRAMELLYSLRCLSEWIEPSRHQCLRNYLRGRTFAWCDVTYSVDHAKLCRFWAATFCLLFMAKCAYLEKIYFASSLWTLDVFEARNWLRDSQISNLFLISFSPRLLGSWWTFLIATVTQLCTIAFYCNPMMRHLETCFRKGFWSFCRSGGVTFTHHWSLAVWGPFLFALCSCSAWSLTSIVMDPDRHYF